jgi:capsular polysaccharide transport system permease protein
MPADVQALLVWNPLVHCVGITRHAFFPSYNADYASLFYVVAIAIAFLLPGLFLITRFRWILAESR